MNTSLFIIIVLASGALAGLVHGAVNLGIVEPYLDWAIGIENKGLFASGEVKDTPEFQVEYEEYRMWQKGGQILAGVILGTSMGALFGIIFALSRKSLPGGNDIKRSLLLAGIIWFVLYMVPFLKYPADLPGVGDGDTVVLRSALYFTFIAISGIGAAGFYLLSRRLGKIVIAPIGYAALVIAAFVAMPDNPSDTTMPVSLVDEFRFMSVVGVSSYWASAGLILGIFWNRFKPHKQVRTSYN